MEGTTNHLTLCQLTCTMDSKAPATATFSLVGSTRSKLASREERALAMVAWQSCCREGMLWWTVRLCRRLLVATRSFWSLWAHVMAVTGSWVGETTTVHACLDSGLPQRKHSTSLSAGSERSAQKPSHTQGDSNKGTCIGGASVQRAVISALLATVIR